jgi:hypothetical protein
VVTHCRLEEEEHVTGELQGKTIAFLATDGVEQVEYTEPRKAVEQAGATAHLLSLKTDDVQGFNHLDKGDTFPVDKAVSEASADDYDGLVLPGGVANPDALRTDAAAVSTSSITSGSTRSSSRASTSRVVPTSTRTITADSSRPASGSAAGQPAQAPAIPAAAARLASPSTREWRPSASSGTELIRRPTWSL